jgi:F0F1-type ATP synthase membrane subunit b/b'
MLVLASSGNFDLSWILEVVSLIPIGYIVWRYVWANGINLRGLMAARAAAIAAQLSAGDEARAQAAALVDAKRSAFEAAKAEAETIRAQSSAAAAEIIAEGSRRASDDYERLLQRAEAEIIAALARVRAEIAEEASAVIVETVEGVIAAELDGVSHHRLIDEAIGATEAEEA